MVEAVRGTGEDVIRVRVPDQVINLEPSDVPDEVVRALAIARDEDDDEKIQSPPRISVRRTAIDDMAHANDKRRRIGVTDAFVARTVIANIEARLAGRHEDVSSISSGSAAY